MALAAVTAEDVKAGAESGWLRTWVVQVVARMVPEASVPPAMFRWAWASTMATAPLTEVGSGTPVLQVPAAML